MTSETHCGASSSFNTAGPAPTAPLFVPVTSVDQLPLAEASGKLDVVAPAASDPYEQWTTTVLVRPVVP